MGTWASALEAAKGPRNVKAAADSAANFENIGCLHSGDPIAPAIGRATRLRLRLSVLKITVL
jgi:hypothetical protein